MQERKNLPKTALPRIFFIDREIASGTYPNATFMAKKYETSVASIKRDIALMRDMLDAPIEYSALHRGFYYSVKTFRLPAGYASADDMLALGMAKNLITIYKNSPLYKAAKDLLDSITAPLDADGVAGWYENRILIPTLASAPVDENIWNQIITGLRKNKKLIIDYKGLKDTEQQQRKISPYQLLFDTRTWFLYGYSEERKGTRLFALARIQNITVTDESFIFPKDFDYRMLENSYFGVFVGNISYKISIEIFGAEAQWVKDHIWAADQKIKETKTGLKLSFTSNQLDKVLRWILALGTSAKPLAPKELVQDWEKEVRGMSRFIDVSPGDTSKC